VTRLKYLSRIFGLHPLAAIALIAADWLLFGEEIATGGVGWLMSIPAGLLLGMLTILIQKRAYKDRPGVATAKGLVAGVLTAIPAPLSSLGLLPMAAFGAIRALSSKQSQLTLSRQ
jgi:hypothetical protein